MQYVTAGESHGPCLSAIVSDVPAGIKVSEASLNADMARRQSGYGRGGRQLIEKDTVRITGGVRFGKTLGSPVGIMVENKDWQNWTDRMNVFGAPPADLVREVTPRPGHADLLGIMKTNSDDCRDILERASARETAARVAASGIPREFLAEMGVEILSYVTTIGSASMKNDDPFTQGVPFKPLDIESSPVRCPDPQATEAMVAAIDEAKAQGESLGGIFRVVVRGLVPGLGGYESADARLTSKLGAALFSIPAMKGVEFGLGFESARRVGSQVHDTIGLNGTTFTRGSNNAGGLEGGMTTGLPLIITVAMKPIPTLMTPLQTVNLDTLEVEEASKERSDTCAVPAAAVVAESEVAFVLATAYQEKFGHDNMADIKAAMQAYKERLRTLGR